MNISLKELKTYFNINKKEAAGFVLMLAMLDSGESFVTINGSIKKTSENTFELSVNENVIEELTNIWLDDVSDPRDDIFK